MDKNDLLTELIQYQLKDIDTDKKLLFNDIKRLSLNLNSSIFNNECSIWTGSLSLIKSNYYINFHLNKKKNSLHRLLYFNYIGDISDSEYIKFTCPNKGKCCSILHIYKIKKDNEPITKKNIILNTQMTVKNNIIYFT
jgi:hypothetical protein